MTKEEQENEPIRFSDLSFHLKIAIIGGYSSFIIWGTSFLVGFITGLIV